MKKIISLLVILICFGSKICFGSNASDKNVKSCVEVNQNESGGGSAGVLSGVSSRAFKKMLSELSAYMKLIEDHSEITENLPQIIQLGLEIVNTEDEKKLVELNKAQEELLVKTPHRKDILNIINSMAKIVPDKEVLTHYLNGYLFRYAQQDD